MTHTSTGGTVLVVEDDTRVCTLVTWQLETEGYTVIEAPDGSCALERISNDKPNLVVLDLSLPGVGGLDILRRVRTAERSDGTPSRRPTCCAPACCATALGSPR
ncbi:MAG: response regulator [Actinophytocola sp.]|nr:response regulator [Actinophytocola sp.]